MLTQIAVYSILGYLSGSFLFAVMIPRCFCNMDIREVSKDGNPGTANVFEHCGARYGIPVAILEFLKGFAPVVLAINVLDPEEAGLLFVPVLLGPILGHLFPVFSHFRGGIGIAPAFGTLIAVFFETKLLVLLVVIYIAVRWIFRVKKRHKRSSFVFSAFLITTLLLETNIIYRTAYSLASLIILFRNHSGRKTAVIEA